MRKPAVIYICLFLLLFLGLNFIKLNAQDFHESFEGGPQNWELQEGWSIVREGANHVLQGTTHTFALLRKRVSVRSLELRFKLIHGTIHFNFCTRMDRTGHQRYFLGFSDRRSYLKKQTGEHFQDLTTGKGIQLNRWHTVKIKGLRERILVILDNEDILSINDPHPLPSGGISFEALAESRILIDDLRINLAGVQLQPALLNAKKLFPQGIHKGDIILTGKQILRLENGSFHHYGNFHVKDDAQLILSNVTLKIYRYQKNLNHWGIYLENRAKLAVDNSKMVSNPDTLIVIQAKHEANVSMKNSPSKIHLFSIFNDSKATVFKSDIVGGIGGAISANVNADIKITDSKIGAIGLYIPKGAVFEANGLRTGYFKNWSLQKNTSCYRINYNITLVNSELVPDNLGPGPYERGWPIRVDSTARVRITNSELRKMVVEMRDEQAKFANLQLNKPTNFTYRDITLQNVRVTGQWGAFLHGSSNVEVTDCEGFWIFIFDKSRLVMRNTHMNEFDPRKFTGEIIFENCVWDTAAEILDNNNFNIRGGLKIGKIGGFSWMNSKVRRFFDVIGPPDKQLQLKKDGKPGWQGFTNHEGHAVFSILFDDNNYKQKWQLITGAGKTITIDFFSQSPINLNQ